MYYNKVKKSSRSAIRELRQIGGKYGYKYVPVETADRLLMFKEIKDWVIYRWKEAGIRK
jgi:hypothetical protein